MTAAVPDPRRRFGPVLLAGLALAACATNPATGERQLSLIGEAQEIEIGRAAHRDVEASLGFTDDPVLQQYVQKVGDRLASRSERPDLPWTFRVVDDPAVNAFALPGGFIYVTRGILAYLGSEAELAAVLGHEIGHVTARHAVNRISKAQLANLGLGVGAILAPDLRRYGDLANVGLGLLFLKYSRDDERQSDELAVRYLLAGDYDPRPTAEVFTTLERASRLGDGGRLPDWLSSHPDPAERRERVVQQIALLPAKTLAGSVEREPYLRRLEGLVFGPNPREGFFREGVFYHPDLRIRLAFPTGWNAQNQKRQVFALSPAADAVVVLTLASEPSAEAAARVFANQRGVRTGGFSRRTVNGLPAVTGGFEAAAEGVTLRGLALFVENGGRVYQILAYGPLASWPRNERASANSLGSFAPVTDPRILNVQPKRIEIVDLSQPMTVGEFARRYPSTVPLEVLAVLNQVDPGGRLPAGEAKRVAGEGADALQGSF